MMHKDETAWVLVLHANRFVDPGRCGQQFPSLRCSEHASKQQPFRRILHTSLSHRTLSHSDNFTVIDSSSSLNHFLSRYPISSMFLKQLLLPAFLAASIAAHPGARPGAGPYFCGTPGPTEEQINDSKAFLAYERSHPSLPSERGITVDTYFHIVAASGS
ncbi:hypothetical protein DHEL01_v206434 [Diaporthe helianthi]|uniref:Uncharacterized protein n=1 Tax=Diaporthe helianthi TaxID=158607 RepID=A0A2P5HY43_DIAHE|nr:hypothetical protein DHEL01_v206434 [Diaporthe helianthi]